MNENAQRIFGRILAKLIEDERQSFQSNELGEIYKTLDRLGQSYPVQELRAAIDKWRRSPYMEQRYEERAENRIDNAIRGEEEPPF